MARVICSTLAISDISVFHSVPPLDMPKTRPEVFGAPTNPAG